jgi:hypothetical protein
LHRCFSNVSARRAGGIVVAGLVLMGATLVAAAWLPARWARESRRGFAGRRMIL